MYGSLCINIYYRTNGDARTFIYHSTHFNFALAYFSLLFYCLQFIFYVCVYTLAFTVKKKFLHKNQLSFMCMFFWHQMCSFKKNVYIFKNRFFHTQTNSIPGFSTHNVFLKFFLVVYIYINAQYFIIVIYSLHTRIEDDAIHLTMTTVFNFIF